MMHDTSKFWSVRPAVRRCVLVLGLAVMMGSAPAHLVLGPVGLELAPAVAFAKSGPGRDGDRDDRDDRDDRRDDDDDRDDRDDRDDDRDDRDGRDDRRDDRDDRRDDDKDDRDDNRRDDRSDSDRDDDGSRSRSNGAGNAAAAVARVEVTINGIVVIYRDGSREILENGAYRHLDRDGRVLEARQATGADLVRLRAHAGDHAAPARAARPEGSSPGQPAQIRIRGRDVTVLYTNGWTEAVDRGRYRLKDRYGHVAVDRAATPEDRARLLGLAGR